VNVALGQLTHMKDLEPFADEALKVIAHSADVAAIAYIIAMIGVGGHLWHGLYSMFHSLGFRHPRFTPGLRLAAATIATLIALGDISIPIAVLSGIVG
jgi:hypothetical protein